MITGTLKSQIDQLWTQFWANGIANPLTVVEQISYLMFARMLDMAEMRNEKKAARLGKNAVAGIFDKTQQDLRWNHLKQLGSEEQLAVVRDRLFPFLRAELPRRSPLGRYFAEAQCMILKPSLVSAAISAIGEWPLQQGDTKGDLYEYLLSKLSTAGDLGQFRTPRHIIAAMAEIVDVKPTDTVSDPACGTAGFLVGAMEYLRRTHSSPALVHSEKDEQGRPVLDDHGRPVLHYPGDLLTPHQKRIERDMFYGFDFDATMLRIAAMNMMLHGIDDPSIDFQDTLGQGFAETYPQQHRDYFDVILANPPFAGTIDLESIHPSLLAVTKTKKTELLFMALIVRMLKTGGRAAVIVPDGVAFGSSKAHVAIREMLVEKNQLDAVISLPSGVFRPYAGVATAILVFQKGGETRDVWFYKVKNDGYSLDDKRNPVQADDLPDLLQRWKARNPKKKSDRTATHFFVPKKEIVGNGYDLSFNRYQEIVHEEKTYEKPVAIIARIRDLDKQRAESLKRLEKMLEGKE